MASITTGPRNHRETKWLKANDPQIGVQGSTKLEVSSGTKALEPDNAPSPHEVAVPSLDGLHLNDGYKISVKEKLSDAYTVDDNGWSCIKLKRKPPTDFRKWDFSQMTRSLPFNPSASEVEEHCGLDFIIIYPNGTS